MVVLASFSWVLNILNVRGAVPCAVPLSQVDSRPAQGVSQTRTHKYIGKTQGEILEPQAKDLSSTLLNG